jgi:hypothetical protein
MTNKLTVLAGLLCLLECCSPNAHKKSPSEQINISIRKSSIPRSVSFSEAIKEIRIVPLETTTGCLLQRVVQVDEAGGKIFVFDQDVTRGLFVFDREGKFLYRFGNKGKGPGEFTGLTTFTFSKDLNTIYFCAAEQKKLIAYDIAGKWIEDIPLSIFYGDLQFLSNNQYVMSLQRGSYFRIGELKSNSYRDTIKFSSGISSYGGRQLFKTTDEGYLYSATSSDTVYSVSSHAIFPKYCFDFGPNKCTAEEQWSAWEKYKNPYPPNKLILGGPYLETNDWFMFRILGEASSGYYRYMVMIRNTITGDIQQIGTDDILFSSAEQAISLTNQNEFVTALDVGHLIEKRDSILNHNQFEYPSGMQERIKKLSQDDNPVLVFFTLK